MQTLRLVPRTCYNQWRSISKCSVLKTTIAAAPDIPAGPPLTVPPPSNVEKPVSPKIEKIFTEISGLTLIEVCELSSVLKKRLNLPDAPVMPVGGFLAAGAPRDDEDGEEPKKEQSSFKVKLMKFDEKQKVALIKEIKALLEGMNLVQAKKFVESAPAIVKENVDKEEAEKLKEALQKVGATIQVD